MNDNTKTNKSVYLEENLNEADKLFMEGYDYAVDEIFGEFFDNLPFYLEESLKTVFSPEELKELNGFAIEFEDLLSSEDYAALSKMTKLLIILKRKLMDFTGNERDYQIFTFIDDYQKKQG